MNRILKSALPIVISAWSGLVFAQSTTTPSSTPGTNRGSQSPNANLPATSADPVMEAIEMNNAEIDLSKTAEVKSQNSKVRSFADMMVKDHGQALAKLRTVQGVTSTEMEPNARHKAIAERLSKLSEAEYDREYMNTMVIDHQEALDFFEKESKAASSNVSAGKTSLAKVSQELIPAVRGHLQAAQKLQKEIENNSQSSEPNANGNRAPGGTDANRATSSPAGSAAPGGNR